MDNENAKVEQVEKALAVTPCLRVYEAPELRRYGTLVEMTHASGLFTDQDGTHRSIS